MNYEHIYGGHTFKYHCELFSVDAYELDGSGKENVPVARAENLGRRNKLAP
jgi:hypothetical protein